MICTQCKKNEANVRFDAVINGKSVKLELCEDCAKTSGFTAPFQDLGLGSFLGGPFNFASAAPPALNELMDLLSSWHAKSTKSVPPSECPACRWTLDQFRRTGRMGCSECYLHFQAETENILKKIHGHVAHKGKKAPAEVAKTKVREREKSLSRLKIELNEAIEKEQFELAATLRDKIREMEQKS